MSKTIKKLSNHFVGCAVTCYLFHLLTGKTWSNFRLAHAEWKKGSVSGPCIFITYCAILFL